MLRYSNCPSDPHGPNQREYAETLLAAPYGEHAINPLTGKPFVLVGPDDFRCWELELIDG